MKNPRQYAKVKTSNTSRGGGGIACPNCGSKIPVSLDHLLGQGRLQCDQKDCKTVLRLNRHRSSEALNAMRNLQQDLKELEAQT